jgi:hypothetical protein
MQREHVQGLALAVIDNGAVVHVAAYGIRNTARDPLTTQTIMYGASLTKTAFNTWRSWWTAAELDVSIADLLPRPLPEYDDYHDLRRRALEALTPILLTIPRLANCRWLEADGNCASTTIPHPLRLPGEGFTSPNWCFGGRPRWLNADAFDVWHDAHQHEWRSIPGIGGRIPIDGTSEPHDER